MKCTVKLGCAVGYGHSVDAGDVGTPTYVDTDYVDNDYQVFIGATAALPEAGDITYSVPIDAPNDDGLVFPLARYQAVKQAGIVDGAYKLTLASVTGGPFDDEYLIETGLLSIPMGVNLAAHT